MVFLLMLLTGVLAGGAVLLTAALVAKFGLCDPLVLPLGNWNYTILPWPMFQRPVAKTIGTGMSKPISDFRLPTFTGAAVDATVATMSLGTFPAWQQPSGSILTRAINV